MQKMMRTASVSVAMVQLVMILCYAAAESMEQQCTSTMTAMTSCLPFAAAKASIPTPDCCTVVKSTVQNNKECLCKFIALVHQGSPEISSLGVQEAKLIQLPSACHLVNVSATDCLKLGPSLAPVGSVNGSAAGNESGGACKMDQLVLVKALVLIAMAAFVFV